MPEVSVLMSVCGGDAGHLRLSLDSILGQDFADLELILVDDGSDEPAKSILEEYRNRDYRVKVITKTNSGLTHSLNVGLCHCNGKYIARQDADDVSSKNRISTQLELMRKKNLKVTSASTVRISETGKQLGPFPYMEWEEIRATLYHRNCLAHGSLMMEADLLKRLQYKEAFKYAQDYELLKRIARSERIEMTKEYLYYLRISRNSISSKKKVEQCIYATLAKYADRIEEPRVGENVHAWSLAVSDILFKEDLADLLFRKGEFQSAQKYYQVIGKRGAKAWLARNVRFGRLLYSLAEPLYRSSKWFRFH